MTQQNPSYYLHGREVEVRRTTPLLRAMHEELRGFDALERLMGEEEDNSRLLLRLVHDRAFLRLETILQAIQQHVGKIEVLFADDGFDTVLDVRVTPPADSVKEVRS